MTYKAGRIPANAQLNEVIERTNDELKQIEQTFGSELRLPTLSDEPARPRNGTVAYADGTAWDPGAGEGIYGYYGGSWKKLG